MIEINSETDTKPKQFDFNLIYPFKNKPKIIPILKKTIAIIFLVCCALWYLIYLLNAFFIIENPGEINSVYKFDGVVTYEEETGMPKKIAYTTELWNKIKFLQQSYKTSMLSSLTYAIPIAMLLIAYLTFRPEKYEKNIYGVSNWYLILTVIYFLFIAWKFFWTDQTFFYKSVEEFYGIGNSNPDITLEGSDVSKDQEGLGFSLKLKRTTEGTVTSSYWVGKEKLSQLWTFQLARFGNIIVFTGLMINVILIAILFILKPKIDREKMIKIQNEIRKKGQANLKGEEYEMDSSIFQ